MGQTEIQHEQDLARVARKDPALYEELPLTSLTAYSLFWLHRWELRRSIEAIAVLNWRLFPKKFAMVGFPEYPDAFRTNRSLLQGQPKYRNILSGAASKGFSLNERGMDIARELVQLLGVPSTSEGQKLGAANDQHISPKVERPPRSIEPEREMERVRSSKLFEKWKSGVMAERDLIHVHALLQIFDHTPTKLRTKALRDLERMAADLHDDDVLKFLQDVRQTFPQALVGRFD